jgi:acyl carrier protein
MELYEEHECNRSKIAHARMALRWRTEGAPVRDNRVGGHMEEQVREILRHHSGLGDTVEHISAYENLWMLGMTSLASVQVMLALETVFHLELPEEKLRHATFSSIYSIVGCVRELIGSPAQ